MKIQTARFGDIEVDDDKVLTFPEGIPGFVGKRYVLVHDVRNPAIQWLQSGEDPAVAFLIMDPIQLRPDYVAAPKNEEIRLIDPGEEPEKTVVVRVIVRSAEKKGELYVNFFAPLLFNVEKRLGMQVPLVGSSYAVREVWPPRPAPPAGEGEAEETA